MLTMPSKTTRLGRCTPSELAKVNVVLIDEHEIRLGCSTCEREWNRCCVRMGGYRRGTGGAQRGATAGPEQPDDP